MGEYLIHYGVKGMKWGIRRYQNTNGSFTSSGKNRYKMMYGVKSKFYKSNMNNDRVLKKGSEYQNISRNKKRDLERNDPVYTSHIDSDNNAYSGRYAGNMKFLGDTPYKNELVLNQDVRIPSQKKAAEMFLNIYQKDPKGMSNSIGKAYADLDYFNGIKKYRDWNAKRISQKFQSKGEDWVLNKGYLIFNQTMMIDKKNLARTRYYKMLSKNGYDALLDVNDIQTGYGAKDPIIFIKPKGTLSMKSAKPLSVEEIEIASARYEYDKALRNRKSFYNIINFDYPYRQAKKNLKKTEKKYGVRQ